MKTKLMTLTLIMKLNSKKKPIESIKKIQSEKREQQNES